MKCPKCGYEDLRVFDSRPAGNDDQVRRRRKCEKCGEMFTTYEKFREKTLKVINSEKKILIYDREKLVNDLIFASLKTDVSLSLIDNIAEEIETFIRNDAKNEITTKKIIEFASDELRKVSNIAYLRYIMNYEDVICVKDIKNGIKK